MTWPIMAVAIEAEADIVVVRQRAHRLAQLLQFDRQNQTRIATAVSEIARNAFSYAGGGRVEFILDATDTSQLFLIRIGDKGDGIADLNAVLEGRYSSPGGMGIGITGARRLLDVFRIRTSHEGTVVELGHRLPAGAPRLSHAALGALVESLRLEPGEDPLKAARQHDRELLQNLDDLRRRQEEAERLNRELEDTNRGVVALYAELDERAEQLRQASEIKSRFLSNMSHEFRTPLNSIVALSRMLIDGVDGALNAEQQRQIGYIRKSAQDLLEMVSDLLDLAKVEAGKTETRTIKFTVVELFSALRGALRPLREGSAVELIFEPAADLPTLHTDEGKVAQVLRNFISNALKFTEDGEVRVSAHHNSERGSITFAVSDTGIGIAPEHQEHIFEEFSQLDGHLQKSARGTGLGLPLSRKLAELLGGEVWVESEVGVGSHFFFSVPIAALGDATPSPTTDPVGKRILIADDDETFRYVLRRILGEQLHHELVEALDGEQALQRIRERLPDIVMLDLQMPRMDGFALMRALLHDPMTCALPMIVCTSLHIDAELKAKLPGGVPVLSKQSVSRERLSALLHDVAGSA